MKNSELTLAFTGILLYNPRMSSYCGIKAMKTEKPDPRKVKNFPLNNSLAKIVCERGKFYVCERKHYWDSTAKKSTEERGDCQVIFPRFA